MHTIKTNLNANSDAYKRALPRLTAALDNIAAAHNARGTLKVTTLRGGPTVLVRVSYMSGAILRDVVEYLDSMSLLD